MDANRSGFVQDLEVVWGLYYFFILDKARDHAIAWHHKMWHRNTQVTWKGDGLISRMVFEGVCSYLKNNCLLFVTENVCAVFSSDGEGDSANICIVLFGILKPDVWMDKKLRFDVRV
jgi:hypothetical protein